MKIISPYIFIVSIAILASSCDDDILNANSIETAEEVADAGNTFLWKRAEDEETYGQFLRNFGVGYSYDAVKGSYCDWKDIRCQVLNRYFVEYEQRRTGENLLSSSTVQYSDVDYKFRYSLRDYVASVNLEFDEKVNLGLYGKTKRTRQNFIEDGVRENFYFTLQEKHIFAHRSIDISSLLGLYEESPDAASMFTLSFRNSVSHLAATADNNTAAVDSFVNIWGTHVIVGADLGASLSVDLVNEMWRYRDQESDDEITVDQFLTAVQENASHSSKDDYVWLENSRLNIDAKGGDQSFLTHLLGEHAPDGTRTFSIDGISQWRTSLIYDIDNEELSNVELVGMSVVPIWKFVEVIDPWVAVRVQSVIQQDAKLQQELLGDWNFFDTSFPVRYPSAKCQYHKDGHWQQCSRTDTEDDPMIVNIISGGRYAATVCHEWIDGIELWVCYPIYEGKVNLACGLGVDNSQRTYSVRWTEGKATLVPQDAVAGQNFYITSGSVGVSSYEDEGVEYAPSQVLPYFEMAGGVQSDGSYSGKVYPVRKAGSTFRIATTDSPTNIVGFSKQPDGCYTRNDNYTYIYNPNEFKSE